MKFLVLIALLFLFAVGLYFIIANKQDNGAYAKLYTEQELQSRKTRFNIGIALVVISVVLCIFLYSYKRTKTKAEMNNDCKTCNTYIQRHRDLRPYKETEYPILSQHVKACDSCSKMCLDYVELAKKHEPTSVVERLAKDCINTTKHAIYAKNELGRLGSKIRQKQAAAWQATKDPMYDPFPTVPKHTPRK